MTSLLADGAVELPDSTDNEDATQPVITPEEGNETVDAPIAKRPDFLEEKFWDAKKGEANLESLSKSYKDLRNEFNRRNNDKPGETVEDYATEEFLSSDQIKNIADDPALHLALDIAKETDMGVKQTQSFINKFLTRRGELPVADAEPVVDLKEELNKLGKNGLHVVSGIKTWIDGMKNQGDINDEVHSELLSLGKTAAGIKALDVLRQKSGTLNIPTGKALTGTTYMTAQDWYSATYETHAEAGESRNSYNIRMREIGKTIFGEGQGTFSGIGLNVSNPR